eukprot:TRINITY_DN1568_c0_g3_i1.p1 TRINITY_DN1568_c0_g3~~TRINITY_DN1568_c0_g3_i1.p1  ORF type:complete len:252 (-),score=33.03 TRINITY_DN1568_c0_g3_i1:63-818(-)
MAYLASKDHTLGRREYSSKATSTVCIPLSSTLQTSSSNFPHIQTTSLQSPETKHKKDFSSANHLTGIKMLHRRSTHKAIGNNTNPVKNIAMQTPPKCLDRKTCNRIGVSSEKAPSIGSGIVKMRSAMRRYRREMSEQRSGVEDEKERLKNDIVMSLKYLLLAFFHSTLSEKEVEELYETFKLKEPQSLEAVAAESLHKDYPDKLTSPVPEQIASLQQELNEERSKRLQLKHELAQVKNTLRSLCNQILASN